MKKKTSLAWTLAFLLLFLTVAAQARSGPHGGQIQATSGTAAQYWLELTVKNIGGDNKELHVYWLDRDGMAASLQQSGYGGITLRQGGIEVPLDTSLVDDGGMISNDGESPKHYRATGKFPALLDTEIIAKVAFPSKRGTGTATFRPFREASAP